jgi:hypothetical protein
MPPAEAVIRLCIVAVAAAFVGITAAVVACDFGRSASGLFGDGHGRIVATARRTLGCARSSRIAILFPHNTVASIGDIAVIVVIFIVTVPVTVAVAANTITIAIIIINAVSPVAPFTLVAALLATVVITIVAVTDI